MGKVARDEDAAWTSAALHLLGDTGPFGALPAGVAIADPEGLVTDIVWVFESGEGTKVLGSRSKVRNRVRAACEKAGLGDPWADRRARRGDNWKRALVLVGAIAGAVAATAASVVSAGTLAPAAVAAWTAVGLAATAVGTGAAIAGAAAGSVAEGGTTEDALNAALEQGQSEASSVSPDWPATAYGRFQAGDKNGAARAVRIAVDVRGKEQARADMRSWLGSNGVQL